MPPVNPDNSSLPLMVTFNLDINRQFKLQNVVFLLRTLLHQIFLDQLREHGDGGHGAWGHDEDQPSMER